VSVVVKNVFCRPEIGPNHFAKLKPEPGPARPKPSATRKSPTSSSSRHWDNLIKNQLIVLFIFYIKQTGSLQERPLTGLISNYSTSTYHQVVSQTAERLMSLLSFPSLFEMKESCLFGCSEEQMWKYMFREDRFHKNALRIARLGGLIHNLLTQWRVLRITIKLLF